MLDVFSLWRWNLLGSGYILFEECSHTKKLNKKEENVLLSHSPGKQKGKLHLVKFQKEAKVFCSLIILHNTST